MGEQLQGKVAAVTGGSAGIGFGITQVFVNEGARIGLLARNPDKGARAVAVSAVRAWLGLLLAM